MIDDRMTFWMVRAENNDFTRHRHPTRLAAEKEAERLAGLNPGIRFYVLESMGHAIRRDPVTFVRHELEIPF